MQQQNIPIGTLVDMYKRGELPGNPLELLRKLLEEGESSGLADYSYETFISELDG